MTVSPTSRPSTTSMVVTEARPSLTGTRDAIVADLTAQMSDPLFDCTVDESDHPYEDPNTVLFVPLSDVSGNLQFHFDQPHKNK